jgi:hypothetical protein
MQNMDYPHMVKLVLYKLKQGTNIPLQAQLDRMVILEVQQPIWVKL